MTKGTEEVTSRDKTSMKEKETHGLRVDLQPLQARLHHGVHGVGQPSLAAPGLDWAPGVVDGQEHQTEKETSKETEGMN